MTNKDETTTLEGVGSTVVLAELREKLHRAESCYSASVRRGDAKFQTDEWYELVCNAHARYERARSANESKLSRADSRRSRMPLLGTALNRRDT